MPMKINGRELPLSPEEESCMNKLMGFGCCCCLCTLCLSWIPLCCYCCKMAKKYPEDSQIKANAANTDENSAQTPQGNYQSVDNQ